MVVYHKTIGLTENVFVTEHALVQMFSVILAEVSRARLRVTSSYLTLYTDDDDKGAIGPIPTGTTKPRGESC